MQRKSLLGSASPIALISLFLAASGVEAQGWRGGGRAKGVVLDAAGSPLPGAAVTVVWAENEGGGPPAVKTDAKGRWSLVGLVAGPWKVRVEAPCYEPFEDDFVVYGAGLPDTLRSQLVP